MFLRFHKNYISLAIKLKLCTLTHLSTHQPTVNCPRDDCLPNYFYTRLITVLCSPGISSARLRCLHPEWCKGLLCTNSHTDRSFTATITLYLAFFVSNSTPTFSRGGGTGGGTDGWRGGGIMEGGQGQEEAQRR